MELKKEDYLGMRRQMNCGGWATITEYNRYNDITVKFDTGETREHVYVSNFLKGTISKKYTNYNTRGKTRYIGMRRKMNCGEWCTIIEYINYECITVKFDTGEIRSNVTLKYFYDGTISKVAVNKYKVGSKCKMECGLDAEIIREYEDGYVDVRFENGVTREHVDKIYFVNKRLAPLTSKEKHNLALYKYKTDGIVMECGLRARLLDLLQDENRNKNKCIIRFDEVGVERNIGYTSFINGTASVVSKSREFNGFIIGNKPLRLATKSEVYFKCTCKKCGLVIVSRLVDLQNHICELDDSIGDS